MKILIAEDDTITRRIIEVLLDKWGYEVIAARDGDEAWQMLQSADPPRLVILDWMMPGLFGVDICRRLRTCESDSYTYVILLTTLNGEEDLVNGMDAGADDYLTKPFRADELRVRLRAGERIIDMENSRTRLIHELRDAMQKVRTLSGMLPICACCKKIRDDKGYWNQLEAYISDHAGVLFSHGLCPDCAKSSFAELEELKIQIAGASVMQASAG